ncbi:SusC/RagA family TonB-linked outer membrane protein [Chitinophaga lutea]
MRRILLLATFLSFCCAPSVWAQTRKAITGTVQDAAGTLLPGVTVKEKGTSNGAMTAADGSFKINAAPNATLIFSFMGYLPQEVQAGSGVVQVTLQEDTKSLNEVVVTALGIKREARKLGYAMTELKGSEIAKTNAINPVAALQGKVAGVDISGAAGGPQAASRIVLRGAKSLTGKDQPIFVIDGTIFENENSDNAVNFGNVLKNFNPDDFETVTVLKGAAATALYGSRAINGAVLITSKKGSIRKGLGIDFSQTAQFEQVYRTPIALQNEFGAGYNPFFNTDASGKVVEWIGGYSFGPKMDGTMAKIINGDIVPFSAQPDNWKDSYQTGKYFNTNVAVEGGNEKGNFRASYSHVDNNSVMPNNGFSRDAFSLKASSVISKYITADAGVNYSISETDNPTRQGGDYTNENVGRKWIYIFPRNYDRQYWMDRYLGPDPGKGDLNSYLGQYPGADYWFSLKHDDWKRKERLLMGNLSLTGTVTDWMKLVLRGNFSNEQQTEDRRQLGWGPNFSGSRGRYALSGVNRTQYTFTGMAMFNPHLNEDFSLSFNVGAETWTTGIGNSYYSSTSGGLRTPGLYALNNSVNALENNSKVTARKRINSVFFAGSFSYKNAWFLDVTGRNDWSSALVYPDGSGTPSYFYPSVSGAWEFTETFKGDLPSFLTYGKVRASYAKVGNDLDPWLINQGYTTGSLWNGGPTGNLPLNEIYQPGILPNKALKPSMAGSIELGADVRFLNNRLGIDFAWYRTSTKNHIIPLAVAVESGVESRYINAGEILNRGIEVAINARPIESGSFQWDLTLNGSRNRNEIASLAPGVTEYQLSGDQDVNAIALVGAAYGVLRTPYAYTPYKSTDPSKNGKPTISANNADIRYKFKRGTAVVGNITPDFNLGLNNNFTYKNWSFGFLVQARIGGDMFSASHQYGTGRGTVASTLPGRDASKGGLSWTDSRGRQRDDGILPDGVFEDGYKIVQNGQEVVLGGMTYKEAYEKGYVTPVSPYEYYSMIGDWGIGIREASVFDASYVALREVSLGYTMPSKFAQRLRLTKARVMLVGRNLGYIYNALPDNINPESLRNNSTNAFSEYGGAPFIRNMAVTLQLGF